MRVKVGASRTMSAISLEAIGPQFISLSLLFLVGLFLFPVLPHLAFALVLAALSLSLIALFEKKGLFIGSGAALAGALFSAYSGQSWRELLFYLPIFLSFWVSLKIKRQAAAVVASSLATKEALERENREKKKELELLLKRVKEEQKGSLQEAREEQLRALEKRFFSFQEKNLLLRRALDEREGKIALQAGLLEGLSHAVEAGEEIEDLIAEGNRVRGLLFAQESLLEEAVGELTRLRSELRLRPPREEPLDLHFFHLYKQLRAQFASKEEELHEARSELFAQKDAVEAEQRLLQEALLEQSAWERELLRHAVSLEETLSAREKEIVELEAILSSRRSSPFLALSKIRF